MGKKVSLKVFNESLTGGYPVTLLIREDGSSPPQHEEEYHGQLPALTQKLKLDFNVWEQAFNHLLDPNYNVDQTTGQPKTVYRQLKSSFNEWLDSKDPKEWEIIKKNLNLCLQHSEDVIRFIIQTENDDLQKLPWQDWELFTQSSTNVEVILGSLKNKKPSQPRKSRNRSKIRILAVFGNNQNIDTQPDEEVLNDLCKHGAEIPDTLKQPTREKLLEKLTDKQGWDIFFFAGHSQENETGHCWFELNNSQEQNSAIEIQDLENALKVAVENGLQLAIFNSCKSLRLARDLASLDCPCPQSIIMRGLVPDKGASVFLKDFFSDFSKSNNQPLYASVWKARDELVKKFGDTYPGIQCIPMIYGNGGVDVLSWGSLRKSISPKKLRATILPIKVILRYLAFLSISIIGGLFIPGIYYQMLVKLNRYPAMALTDEDLKRSCNGQFMLNDISNKINLPIEDYHKKKWTIEKIEFNPGRRQIFVFFNLLGDLLDPTPKPLPVFTAFCDYTTKGGKNPVTTIHGASINIGLNLDKYCEANFGEYYNKAANINYYDPHVFNCVPSNKTRVSSKRNDVKKSKDFNKCLDPNKPCWATYHDPK